MPLAVSTTYFLVSISSFAKSISTEHKVILGIKLSHFYVINIPQRKVFVLFLATSTPKISKGEFSSEINEASHHFYLKEFKKNPSKIPRRNTTINNPPAYFAFAACLLCKASATPPRLSGSLQALHEP